MSTTTLTIDREDKESYDNLKSKVNDLFKENFGIDNAYNQVKFFKELMKFLNSRELELLNHYRHLTNVKFWETVET